MLKKEEGSMGRVTRYGSETPAHSPKKVRKKKKGYEIDIYRAWCKACGICVAFCPAKVLDRGEDGYPEVVDPEACIGCGWCEIHCPDFAITVHEKKE